MEPETRLELAKMFNDKGFKIGAEVGVAGGHYSKVLIDEISGLKLFCIDPWAVSKGNQRGGGMDKQEANWELVNEMLKGYNVTLIRNTSMEAVGSFEDKSLDFVYLDGNHNFDFVMEDLINWTTKVRHGGIVSGHDYYQFRNSGVIEAVDIYVKMHGKELHVGTEREASWWFRR